MKIYTIYAREFAPEVLLNKYPKPAEYAEGKLYLFGESLESVSGTPAEVIYDLSAQGLKDDDDTENEGMTKPALTALVTQLLGAEPTGMEVKLSISQGRYLYATMFAGERAASEI